MDNNVSSSLFELHTKKLELYNEIVRLDKARAKMQDEYRTIALRIHKIEDIHSAEIH